MSRAALVTGAGRGIGRAIAERLAGSGVTVGVVDVALAAAEATCTAIVDAGGRARPIAVDVTDEPAVRAAFDRFAADEGRLDVLVNNAGIFPGEAPVDRTDTASWARTLEVNLTGAFLACKVAVPHLRATGGGRIVNVASRAWLGSPRLVAYSASKGGLISLTRSLAMELGHDGITVNAVSPTSVDTPLFAAMDEQERQVVLDRLRAQPIPRIGQPSEVAFAVAFFAAEEAGYITGQHLYVGGGAELRGSTLI